MVDVGAVGEVDGVSGVGSDGVRGWCWGGPRQGDEGLSGVVYRVGGDGGGCDDHGAGHNCFERGDPGCGLPRVFRTVDSEPGYAASC